MFNNVYPYTDFHELNLDWILEEINKIRPITPELLNIKTPQMFKNYPGNDWTKAINDALTAAGDYGVLYFPKGEYYISNTIEVKYFNVTIFSVPRAEYQTQIYTDKDITIMHIDNAGCTISNIEFWRKQHTETMLTDGINIERITGGVKQENSNLDTTITNCGFYYLHSGIIGKGRNVNVFSNLFNECQIAIKGITYTYEDAGITKFAQFRGWEIKNNRFHVIRSLTTLEATPKTLAESNVWCIDFPLQNTDNSVSCSVIHDNFYDYGSGGFYKGSLRGAVITDNVIENCCGAFVYSSESSQIYSGGLISGNKYTRDWSANFPDFPATDIDILSYIIYIDNIKNVRISNNIFDKSQNSHIYLYNTVNCLIENNSFITFVYGVNAINSSGNIIKNNIFDSRSDTATCIKVASGNVYTDDNINNSSSSNTILYDVPATSFKHINNALDWVIPELENSWTLMADYSQGYRKLVNGYTEIRMTVKNGTDNTAVFYLPEGFRPKANFYIPACAVWNGNTECYVQVNASNGRVLINAIGTSLPSFCVINCIFES